jgi:small subunit ribosomal protein S7
MSRRKSQAQSRPKTPDQYYGSVEISQFINMIMKDGKKQLATRIVRESFETLYAFYLKDLGGKTTIDLSSASDAEGEEDGQSGINFADLDKKEAVVKLFDAILDKVGPNLELVSKRVGGANIQVPVMVRSERRSTIAMRFIIKNARSRISQMKSFANGLAQEMIDVLKGSAKSLDDKEQTLRMAKANAVFGGIRR